VVNFSLSVAGFAPRHFNRYMLRGEIKLEEFIPKRNSFVNCGFASTQAFI